MTRPTVALRRFVTATRDLVEPGEMPHEVLLYSIPGIERTGGPVLEPSQHIDSGKLRLSGGEVLLSRLNPRKSRIALVPRELEDVAVCSPEFVVMRPGSSIDPRYLAYWLGSEPTRRALDSAVRSVTRSHQRVEPEEILSLAMPLIDMQEQRRIADFLDEQVARIDEARHCRERQIERLREEFSSLVVQATTVGLNPEAETVPTDIPWAPEINASWSTVPARALLSLRRELVGDAASRYVLLSLTKKGVIPRDTETNDGKYPASFETYQAVDPGDLIFCLFDVDETPRTVGLVHQCGMLTGAYTRFEVVRTRALSEYLNWFFIGVDDLKAFRPLYTGMRKTIQTDRFLSARLPLPDLQTQAEISAAIRDFSAASASLTDSLAKSVCLLNEYKSSLITAAVTGELDVSTAGSGVPA